MAGVAGSLSLGVAPEWAKVLCVFLHGRTQTPEVMEAAVIRHLNTPDVAYLLPRAAGATWYNARAVDPLTASTRADLALSVTQVASVVMAMQAQAPGVPLVLAGFSQGACLALELAFSGLIAPQGLVALTGCRVGSASNDRATVLLPELPVYLSAGQEDPWIPLSAFAEAVVALGHAGARLRTDVYPGRPHEVSAAELAMLDGVLSDIAADKRPGMATGR